MKTVVRLLRNRNFILLLAIVLGLSIGRSVAVYTAPTIIPLLALVMTLSATNVTSREFTSLREMPRSIMLSLFLNYVVMGGLTLLLAWWLIEDSDLWAGFIVLATVPPAVAVFPFSYVLGGNTLFSLIGMIAAYLAALAIMPGVIALFLGTGFFNPMELLIILGELILAPIVFSRILLVTGLSKRINPWRGTIVNWSFFVTLFTIVGLNREAFFSEFDILVRIIVISIAISFILGFALDLGTRALRVPREDKISMMLMGTMKNYGLASGILLALFGERAAIPASIAVVFGILHIVWLGFRFRKKPQPDASGGKT
jgi:BASS family bile acid:Na+ symporter